MNVLYFTTIFILGAATGSFLNVCAYRLPRGQSVVRPASRCPFCGTEIAARDNIPVLSYLLLRGRCRSCGARISPQYPLLEGITGLLWAVSYYRFGLTENLVYSLFFVTILVLLAAIDFQTKTIPDRVLLPSMAVSAALLLLYFFRLDVPPLTNETGIAGAAIGFLGGGGILFVIAALAPLLFKKEAMGGGDIKLAAFMGLYLGGYVFMAIFLGSFLGALAGAALMARGKVGAKDMIPFGPFLAAGAVLTVFFGPQLWTAYLKLAGL